MNLLPKASGTRPRVACEIMPQGVVAARSDDATAPLSAVAGIILAEGALLPGLKPGNVVDRLAVTAAVRRTLEQIGARPNARDADIALVIPDSAVRVLLLEFEALPNKLSEALPLVRFRLKKLLPFDADEAAVTFQVMSSGKNIVRVVAVAIPRDVLSEYETAVREAGFEPGAVLPSTLACLAVVEDEAPVLVVNANSLGITTAIARGGVLLLHRSVDLQAHGDHAAVTAVPDAVAILAQMSGLPLVDTADSAGEWAAQQPLPEHGRNPYADRVSAESAVQNFDSFTSMPTPGIYVAEEPLSSVIETSVVGATPSTGEIAQAVSVAAAYFEDTLAIAPTEILSAGPLGAKMLGEILTTAGVGDGDGLRVHELVDSAALLPTRSSLCGSASVAVRCVGGAPRLMRISINLATRPFVELRPFFLRLRVLMAALAVIVVAAIIAAHVLKAKVDIADAQIDRLHARTVAAQQEKLANERRMRQPANAAVLDRAHFLNALFRKKELLLDSGYEGSGNGPPEWCPDHFY